MPQADMTYELFEQRLQEHIALHDVPTEVSLQGEGEPTLHRDFFRMAERVREIGSQPYTITNGTHKHPERFIGLFPRIGVSIDSLNADEAKKIGRYNLPRVLAFIEALRNNVDVIVHSVAVSFAAREIALWCRQRRLAHVIQPLQAKADYRYRYPEKVRTKKLAGRFSCRYLAQPIMRYYTIAGIELPCPFIKDVAKFPGMPAMHDHQRCGTLAACCEGCRHAGTGVPSHVITRSG